MKNLNKKELVEVVGGWGACRTAADCRAIEEMQKPIRPLNVGRQICSEPGKNGKRYCTMTNGKEIGSLQFRNST